jgi:hypothetical protein
MATQTQQISSPALSLSLLQNVLNACPAVIDLYNEQVAAGTPDIPTWCRENYPAYYICGALCGIQGFTSWSGSLSAGGHEVTIDATAGTISGSVQIVKSDGSTQTDLPPIKIPASITTTQAQYNSYRSQLE